MTPLAPQTILATLIPQVPQATVTQRPIKDVVVSVVGMVDVDVMGAKESKTASKSASKTASQQQDQQNQQNQQNQQTTHLLSGAELRQMREAVGMSQMELAEALGYSSRATVCRWESGETQMPRSQYAPIIRVLGEARQKLEDYRRIMAGIAAWPTIGTLA